jgi:uncharacterized protein YhhL (DUF1145 family)
MRSYKEAYDQLHSLAKLIVLLSCIVIVLFLIIKFDENVPLWLMITAVVIALMDGFLVIGYSHSKDDLAKRIKEGKDQDE